MASHRPLSETRTTAERAAPSDTGSTDSPCLNASPRPSQKFRDSPKSSHLHLPSRGPPRSKSRPKPNRSRARRTRHGYGHGLDRGRTHTSTPPALSPRISPPLTPARERKGYGEADTTPRGPRQPPQATGSPGPAPPGRTCLPCSPPTPTPAPPGLLASRRRSIARSVISSRERARPPIACLNSLMIQTTRSTRGARLVTPPSVLASALSPPHGHTAATRTAVRSRTAGSGQHRRGHKQPSALHGLGALLPSPAPARGRLHHPQAVRQVLDPGVLLLPFRLQQLRRLERRGQQHGKKRPTRGPSQVKQEHRTKALPANGIGSRRRALARHTTGAATLVPSEQDRGSGGMGGEEPTVAGDQFTSTCFTDAYQRESSHAQTPVSKRSRTRVVHGTPHQAGSVAASPAGGVPRE